MRILAIYRHYWPDATPYARLLKVILEEQIAQGHQVEVLCGQPSYNDIQFERQPWREVVGGVQVRRFALFPERKRFRLLRAFNYLTFLARAVLQVCRGRQYNLIIANTQPPILMGIALRVIKALTGIPYILHVQDIHPESAAIVGQLRSPWLLRLLQKVDTYCCKDAWRLVTLSEDMRQTLLRRDATLAAKIMVINNFGLTRRDAFIGTEHKSDQPLRVIFAGNIGRFQALERLVEAVAILRNEFPLEVTFMGAGSEVGKLQHLVRDLELTNVKFVPYETPEVAARSVAEADLGVVSLAAGVCRVGYPSKTMAYVTAGCPVLAIVETGTQLAQEVVRHEFGYVPAGTSPLAIADALRMAWRQLAKWTGGARRKLAARGEQLFGKQQAMQQWNKLFAEIDSTIGATKHTCARKAA